jgi:retinol dehydrogenase 12
MFLGELAKQIKASNKQLVVINTVNPGFCDTDLWRNAPWPLRNILALLGKYVGRTPEMGSRILMWAVFVDEESHGKYIGDCMIREESNLVRSKEGQVVGQKLFRELLAVLESAAPGISEDI